MDDDERKEIIAAGARAFMELSWLYKLPGHKSCESDCGLWKLVIGGATMVKTQGLVVHQW